MNTLYRRVARILPVLGVLLTLTLSPVARADGQVGTSLPSGFPVIADASLGKPLIGFGAAGPVTRRPVVFVHGNNDTPLPHGMQPVRQDAGVCAVPCGPRLRVERAVGPGLPG